MKFAIKTLGCKVNQYETELIRENLIRLGFEDTLPEQADIFILNSCTVTGQADIKTRKLIHRIKRDNPNIKIFVTGCYAVLKDDISALEGLPEVCKVVPNKDKMRLPYILKGGQGVGLMGPSARCGFSHKAHPLSPLQLKEGISQFSSHSRAFVKIQDGCDERCSYCKVSIVRGPSRSREKEDVLNEINSLAKNGYKEIVLTGICLGSWGKDKRVSLSELLKKIDNLEGAFRVRLSSIESNHIDDDLIGLAANSRKICHHFHIPLQSGSNKILKAMNRKYTALSFNHLIDNIRNKMPLAGISMDVMVGFPGEAESDFMETIDLIESIRPSRLHVFSYSDRKGTPSFEMTEKLPKHIIQERSKELIKLGERLAFEFCKNFIGKDVEILVEGSHEQSATSKNSPTHQLCEGYTREYVRAKVEGFNGSLGDILCAEIKGVEKKSPCLSATLSGCYSVMSEIKAVKS